MSGALLDRTREIDAVIFDYGGVLTTPVKDTIADWIERDRIDPTSFSRALKRWLSRDVPTGTPIHRLETGELSTDQFNVLMAQELTTLDGSAVESASLLARLFSTMKIDPAMITLVEDLRRVGVRTALLSNSWGSTYPRPLIDSLFDPIVISSEVGLRKPDPQIFELALSQTGTSGQRSLFVDDAEPNVDGARFAGLRAYQHVAAESTRAFIADLVPDLSLHQSHPLND